MVRRNTSIRLKKGMQVLFGLLPLRREVLR